MRKAAGQLLQFFIGRDLPLNEERRRVMLVFFLLLGMPILASFSAYHFLTGNFLLGAFNFIFLLGIFGCLFLIRFLKRAANLYRFCALQFAIFSYLLIIRGGPDGSMSLWSFFFPVLVLCVLGNREGIIWVALYAGGICTLFLSPKWLPFDVYDYHTGFISRFMITFLVLSGMAFIVDSTRSIYQKRLESEHRKLQQQKMTLAAEKQKAEDANAALNESLTTLKITQANLVQAEKMAALGGLVAGISHEINTPLGVGITASSFLEDTTTDFKSKFSGNTVSRKNFEKYLDVAAQSSTIILTNLNRAAELVRSFKQIAADQTSEEIRRFNLKDYLDQLVFSLQPEYKRTKHTIQIDCPKDIVMVSYPGAVSQVVTNLIMNSLVHGFEGIESGIIRLDCIAEGARMILTYADNGIGMDKDTLEKSFNPFFTTKRSHGGTGLGMPIIYNLITQTLKGRIDYASAPGVGVSFQIQLPLKVV